MRLRIVTPLDVAVDVEGVLSLRAEDATGSFGILPGHADFITSLAISVVAWDRRGAPRRWCAVRRGLLRVTAGREIAITTREAVPGDDLAALAATVLDRFRAEADAERTEHAESTRLQLAAIRRIVAHIHPAPATGLG